MLVSDLLFYCRGIFVSKRIKDLDPLSHRRRHQIVLCRKAVASTISISILPCPKPNSSYVDKYHYF